MDSNKLPSNQVPPSPSPENPYESGSSPNVSHAPVQTLPRKEDVTTPDTHTPVRLKKPILKVITIILMILTILMVIALVVGLLSYMNIDQNTFTSLEQMVGFINTNNLLTIGAGVAFLFSIIILIFTIVMRVLYKPEKGYSPKAKPGIFMIILAVLLIPITAFLAYGYFALYQGLESIREMMDVLEAFNNSSEFDIADYFNSN